MSDLTFQQINNVLGSNVFSYDGSTIKLDVSAITGDNYTSLSDEGIIEFAFKFLKACYDTQVNVNGTNTVNPLTSFSTPFYGTVQNNNPPTIEGSITVTGVIPLDVDSVVGR
ncbi:hypothetical protein H6G11_10080 [Cyanobacterium aponinum FACHB-4101]|uniref:hypothetical protein n=1 Tax=Cyanobacterium aponinum TaxID=379064 RepID=UPI0016805A72|nr:hypothetical protein [Cyanobacterium aponinum]MBD2394599.1 hypothetical protein [Cyanobacterium aponinum FACHB-4101]